MSLPEIFFLVPVIAVGGAAAIHATAYIHGEERKYFPRFWCFFAATLAAMASVILSEGKLAFLLSWEAMGLASAGLVAFESTKKSAKKATWIYLLACHAGAGALMLAFAPPSIGISPVAALFCAIVGFGLKIGFPPFHSWLPEAHPAAPAPASAIMSGAMIPLGFYGLLKFCPFTSLPEPTRQIFGWTLLVLGAAGAISGMLFAMAQSNLKRLLAFSSVENMGIVAMALGLAALSPNREISKLLLGGALVHVLNHAFLKGALFLGAGSVLRQTGTLDLDRMGGLMRRMPFTGTLFTVNAIGLSGLPPLNGFIGELAVYIASFALIASGEPHLICAGFVTAISLAFSGALAVAAYSKAIGGAFLGLPRTDSAARASETPRRMWIVQAALTAMSILMVPASVLIVDRFFTGCATGHLASAAVASAAIAALTLGFALLRRFMCPRGARKTFTPTWDCGYHAPTPRMAYTATAFVQPLADFFRRILRTRKHLIAFKGDPSSPSDAAIATETDDATMTVFWQPIFTKTARIFQRAHLIQNGSLHLYILIIIIAVLALLVSALVP